MFGRGARFFRYRYLVAFVTLFIIGDSLAVFGGLASGGPRFFACFLIGGAACLIAAFVFALRKTHILRLCCWGLGSRRDIMGPK